MDYIQQEINMHKSKLLNLINNLINTQLIDNEISINNEIKIECECLKSILNIKQNQIMNQQINLNNNVNFNPFIVQPNLQMNQNIINMNNQIIPNNEKIINILFTHISGKNTTIHIFPSEKISELIKRYKEKSQDFNENNFLFNGRNISDYISRSIAACGIVNGHQITVIPKY